MLNRGVTAGSHEHGKKLDHGRTIILRVESIGIKSFNGMCRFMADMTIISIIVHGTRGSYSSAQLKK